MSYPSAKRNLHPPVELTASKALKTTIPKQRSYDVSIAFGRDLRAGGGAGSVSGTFGVV